MYYESPLFPLDGNGPYHDHARHVLVTARDGDVGVVALRTGDGLDRVGDDFAGLEGVAHAWVSCV